MSIYSRKRRVMSMPVIEVEDVSMMFRLSRGRKSGSRNIC